MKHLSFCLAAIVLLALATNCQEEVVINAQPLVYLTFTNPPFTANSQTFVPLAEVTSQLKTEVKLSAKDLLILRNDISKKDIVFAPARAIAKKLKLDISRSDNYLTIGNLTWEVKAKVILTDLDRQRIFAFEGFKLVFNCRTCTGTKETPTKPGIFKVFKKIPGWHYWKATKRVHYPGKMYNSIYFDPPIRAFHGVDNKNMKGSFLSHGCARMFCTDADWLYPWTPLGTTVYVIP